MGVTGFVRAVLYVMACEGAVAPVGRDADQDGWHTDDGDCNDSDARVHPGAPERCDGMDDDCDGQVDEDAEDAPTWHDDADGDGYGNVARAVLACVQPAGTTDNASDCDDGRRDVHPGVRETCNGRDDDCDGSVDGDDAEDATRWYRDDDDDGFGRTEKTRWACEAPRGHVGRSGDCRDDDPAVHPGAPERCNTHDDDCDGLLNEAGALGEVLWYPDGDADGWGQPSEGLHACDRPEGFTGRIGDCDDARASVYPGATERCDGTDEDCDGVEDEPWGHGCLELQCEGNGQVHVVPNECMDDNGASTSEDALEVYCVSGIARFCLSGEDCPWRDAAWTDDGTTCSTAGLVSQRMATVWCDAWEGHQAITCSDGHVGW